MNEIVKTLNNRDYATLIWVSILIPVLLSQKTIRTAFITVIERFFVRPIISAAIFISFYIVAIVFFSSKYSIITIEQFKVVFVWAICAIFNALFNSVKASEDMYYFKQAFWGQLKIVIVLEFFINLYVFSLPIEFVLLPVITFLVTLSVVSGSNSKYSPVDKVLKWILAIIGFSLLFYTIYSIYIDFDAFLTLNNLRNFIIPPVYSILLLPVIYIMALSVCYESLFIRIPFFVKDPELRFYLKFKVIEKFHFRLGSLKEWSKYFYSVHIKDKADLIRALKREV